ncbi:hypothetical protein [Actinomadura keratinilytica]|uniref:hypothetical protein n=1 Tax=Actinomadura keratinilytica TaxID=547461 RepID=UPI00360F336D
MRSVPPRRILVTGAVTAGLVVVAAPLSLAAVPEPVRVQVTAAQGTPFRASTSSRSRTAPRRRPPPGR